MTTGMCGGRPTAVGCTLDQHRALLVRHALTARSRTPTAMHAAAALITIVGFAAGLFPAGCSAQMETALAGRTLSVVGFHFPPYVTQNADGTVTGLSVDVLDELQSRAGFTYTLTIVPISGSWTKFLEAKIESGEYDLTVNWCAPARGSPDHMMLVIAMLMPVPMPMPVLQVLFNGGTCEDGQVHCAVRRQRAPGLRSKTKKEEARPSCDNCQAV
eukprot:SAG31_NODE_638_length_13329_cov_13.538095_13_plen_215_part_00